MLRIVLDGGEVLSDRWPSEAEATTFLSTVHLGMRGIESPAGERDNAPVKLPSWATRENAEVAAREVESAMGSRARTAEVYARTLLGIGEPAPVIDPDNIEACFDAALLDGKVLVLAGMNDPTHANTSDPILEHSPLVRLALATVEFLIARGKDPSEAVDALEFAATNVRELRVNGTITMPYGRAVTCVVTLGEDGLLDVIRTIALPRLGFSHCALNDALFADWVGWYGNPGVRRSTQEAPSTGLYDADRPEHRATVEKLAEIFNERGGAYSLAATRMRQQMQ